MNNSGKGMLFLVLVPLIAIAVFIISDTFVSFLENNKFKMDTESIITEVMNNENLYYSDYYDEIKRLYELKHYNTDNLVVDANEYEVSVSNENLYFGLINSLKNTKGENSEITILGHKFMVKKNSKAIISVVATYEDEEIKFTYKK